MLKQKLIHQEKLNKKIFIAQISMPTSFLSIFIPKSKLYYTKYIDVSQKKNSVRKLSELVLFFVESSMKKINLLYYLEVIFFIYYLEVIMEGRPKSFGKRQIFGQYSKFEISIVNDSNLNKNHRFSIQDTWKFKIMQKFCCFTMPKKYLKNFIAES